MQLKRLFSTLLVVVLVMMAAVLTVAAEESENVFEFTVESNSTVNSDGALSLDSTDQLDVSITIEKNPGTKYISFDIIYDAEVLTLVKDSNGLVVYEAKIFDFVYEYGATPKSTINFDTPGVIKVMNDPLGAFNSSKLITDLGEFLTFSFTVADDFHGETEIKIENAATSIDIDETIGNGAKIGFHTFEATSSKVEPTCTEHGYDAVKCTACDFVQENNIVDALGHKPVEVKAEEPTCTEDGHTAGEQCSVCKEYMVEPEVIPATGHTPVDVKKLDATCTEDGHEAGKQCSVCEEVVEGLKVIKATGHDVKDIAETPATCTVAGKTASQVCNTCDEVLKAAEVIPATGHTTVLTEGKAATCTEDGYTSSASCSVCKEELVKSEVVKATGHTLEVIAPVEPTADREGATQGEKCSVCGTVTKEPTVIPATGAATTDDVQTTEPADDDEGSLLWLWIVLAVVVVAGAGVAVYFLVIKKKQN